jgi:OOP family OmpA-OmpF porin
MGGAEPSGSSCDPKAVFGPPRLLDGVNSSSSEINAQLSPDELTIYVASSRGGTYDLYAATRATRAGSFGAPGALENLNSASRNEEGPSISSDGLTLYFASNRNGATGPEFDLFVTTRISSAADFPAPMEVAMVNSAATDSTPSLAADGLTLYFTSTRLGVAKIFRASRSSASSAFSAPSEIAELSVEDQDADSPVVSADQRSIYFSSSRPGTQGASDIWTARRSTRADGFGPPEPVAELNTLDKDWPLWLSPDGCRLYLASDRAGGAGGYDIYVAERSRP